MKVSVQSFGEEIANSVTHGVSALMVLGALPFALIHTYNVTQHSWSLVAGVYIFCLSIFMMFLMSALYHAMPPDSRHKGVFKILDHIFIYVAIAGSYTPVVMQSIQDTLWMGLILVLQWGMVLFGILYKSIARKSMPKTSLSIYLVMGWTALLVFPQFVRGANPYLFWLILIGGVFYSIGAIFYATKAFKFWHMVWHLFVFLGALLHFIGICFYLV